MPEFIILRNAAAVSTASGFEAFGPGALALGAAGAPEPRIESHDMSVGDAVSAARDPTVSAVAVPMQIKLIEPLDVEAGVSATNAWGIGAVRADVSTMTGDGVVVSVLDTGIDKTHPAFAGVEHRRAGLHRRGQRRRAGARHALRRHDLRPRRRRPAHRHRARRRRRP